MRNRNGIRFVLYLVGSIIAIAFLGFILKSFGEREVTAADVVTGMTSVPFWILFILGVITLVVWAIIYRRAPQAWAFVILLGVTIFHWLFWAVAPNAWGAWFHGQFFWPMNVAIVLTAFLWSQQGATARYAGFALGALIVVAIGIGTYKYFGTPIKTPTGMTTTLSADVVLPIIAECESGGKQFGDDGNVIQNKTDDIGKWQIHLPTHWGRAESLGISLWKEEGNEKFARLLYSENGTTEWNSSRSCWEPKVLALGGENLPSVDEYLCPSNFTYVVTRNWGRTVARPAGCQWVIERKVASVSYQISAVTKEGQVVLDIPAGERPKNRDVIDDMISFRLRIIEGDPAEQVPVMVSLYR